MWLELALEGMEEIASRTLIGCNSRTLEVALELNIQSHWAVLGAGASYRFGMNSAGQRLSGGAINAVVGPGLFWGVGGAVSFGINRPYPVGSSTNTEGLLMAEAGLGPSLGGSIASDGQGVTVTPPIRASYLKGLGFGAVVAGGTEFSTTDAGPMLFGSSGFRVGELRAV